MCGCVCVCLCGKSKIFIFSLYFTVELICMRTFYEKSVNFKLNNVVDFIINKFFAWQIENGMVVWVIAMQMTFYLRPLNAENQICYFLKSEDWKKKIEIFFLYFLSNFKSEKKNCTHLHGALEVKTTINFFYSFLSESMRW